MRATNLAREKEEPQEARTSIFASKREMLDCLEHLATRGLVLDAEHAIDQLESFLGLGHVTGFEELPSRVSETAAQPIRRAHASWYGATMPMRSSRRHVLGPFGCSFVAMVGGCAAAGDGAGTAGQEPEYTVTPTGGSAALLVTLPAGTTLTPETKIIAQRPDGPGVSLVPGEARAVSAGTYCLKTTVSLGDHAFTSRPVCNVPVTNGQQTKVAFGAVTFELTPGERVLGADARNEGVFLYGASAPDIEPLALPKALPHPAGTFDYRFGPDRVRFTVVEDKLTTDIFDKPASSGLARLLPPPLRDFPDATRAEGFSVVAAGWLSKPIVSIDAPLVVRASSATFQSSSVGSVPVPLAREGQPATPIQLGRIDVDDVAVTMPDGTVKRVPGTFTINRAGWGSLCNDCTTKHGVDAPPGQYRIIVKYTHPGNGSTVRSRSSTARR